MRTVTCKHKIWGENWLYLRPYLKAFPVFNVLETCRVYLSHIFTDADVVNAQTWEVSPLKIPSSKSSAYLLLALSWGPCNLTSPGRSITWQKDRVKVKRQQSFMYKFIASLIFFNNDRFVWTVSLPLTFEKGKCLHYYPFYVLVRHPWRNLNICFKLSLFCLFEFSHFYCVRHEHCAIPFYNITGLQHHNILSCWTSTFFLLFMWSYPICSSFRLFHGIGCNLFHKVVF